MTALENILVNIATIGLGAFTFYMWLKLLAIAIVDFNIWKYGCWWGKMPEWLQNIVDRLSN